MLEANSQELHIILNLIANFEDDPKKINLYN